MKKLLLTTITFLILGAAFFFGEDIVSAATYTVSPSEYGAYDNYKTIRNTLTKIGEEGGGTIVFKSGRYPISNTLYVQSKTTLKFEQGVTLEKDTSSGSSSTMFQFIPFAWKDAGDMVSGYNGMHDIHFVGDGTTVIDMKNYNQGSTNAIAMVMANNKNVSFKGITFQNVKKGHLVEMDGCYNVRFEACTFKNMADNKYHNKEAVNLDTNDWKTGGFSQSWSKKDNTPNKNISFEFCHFENLVRAVGTHRYSAKKYHTNIRFINNQVVNVKTPLGMLNWKNSTISDNTFTSCKANKKYNYSFFMAGVRNVNFTRNQFINVKAKDVLKYYDKYQTSQKEYKATKSKLSKKNIKALKKNYVKGTKRKFKLGKKKYKWKKLK